MFKGKKGHSGHVHVLIGFAILTLIFFLNDHYKWMDISKFTYLDYAFFIFVTWVYSQMPDADQPGSRISEYVTIFGLGIIIYSLQMENKVLGITTAILLGIFRIVGHRTVIHSLFAGLLLSAPLWYVSPVASVIAFIMFIGHITSEGEFSLLFEKDWHIFK